MSFNAALINTYFEKTFTLDTGVARVWTFQSPPYATTINALDYASDSGATGTHTLIATLVVNSDTRITGAALTSNDTVTHNTAADSGKSLVVPPDATMSITLSSGGTIGNVLGICVSLKMSAIQHYPQGS